MARAKPTRSIRHQGKSFPPGATLCCSGTNFSVLAKHVERRSCCRSIASMTPSRPAIDLDPYTDHAFHYWHTFVPGLTAGRLWLRV